MTLLLPVAVVSIAPSAANAFHSGGVGMCEGCHTMHNSSGGQAAVGNFPQFTAGPYLLKGSDQSSTCLNCHEGTTPAGAVEYQVSTTANAMPDQSPPLHLTPGGDFGWLKKSYTWVSEGGVSESSAGERHGHNIRAVDYGYAEDSTISQSPGGDYPSARLSCISCHDPHGRYRITGTGTIATTGKPIRASGSYGELPDSTTAVGVFRLIGGTGYKPKSVPEDVSFVFPPFFAVAPQDYNRSEASGDTRVSYGRGTSLWCANCHEQMHTTFGTVVHAVDQPLGPLVTPLYNTYKKTGDRSGDKSTAYTSLVPFQMNNTADLATLAGKIASTEGAVTSDRITCFSCHRSHASGWDSIGRWNFKTTFLVYDGAWPGGNSPAEYGQGRSTTETRQAYYDRDPATFASYQRSLCNKCHVMD